MMPLLPLALLVPLGALAGTGAEEPRNPHEDPTACDACHQGTGPEPGPALPVVETCRGCHEDDDMHPVQLQPDRVPVPEAWPLTEGRVTCWTCHTEPACTAGGPAGEDYLRGGSFGRITEFCYHCHQPEVFEREDPHHPKERRSEADSTCTACHVGLPQTGAAPEQARLREVEGGVCSTCHEPDPHYGTHDHLNALLDTVPIERVPPQVALPSDGRVQCWSCHEVHDETPELARRWHRGHTLAQALRADEREAWELQGVEHWPCDDPGEHPPMLALPLEDGSLCHACHAEGGEHP
jgi:hypothetical protein